MAQIVITIDEQVPYKDLVRLKDNIVKSLKQQNIPVVMAYTNDKRQHGLFDTVPSQNDTVEKPLDKSENKVE